MRGEPGIPEIDGGEGGGEYGLVHENSRNRRGRRTEWRNLQQFLIIRADRPVHAAGGDRGRSIPANLNHLKLGPTVRRDFVRRELMRKARTRPARDLQK